MSPLQALNLTTGASDSDCRDAPPAGLLLQTTRPVTLRINGVDVRFAGTIFVERRDDLFVHVLESRAAITSAGVTEEAVTGQRIRVPAVDEGFGPPYAAELYVYVQIASLPFELLPQPLESLPVNVYGLVTPAAPDQNPLVEITAQDACTVAAVNEVRLRQGPGLSFPITASLQPGESVRPDARAEGPSDGLLWWRLAQDLWVRSDVVLAAGLCGDLPLLTLPLFLTTATPEN